MCSITYLSHAQGSHCNMNGNLMVYTNYDGGPLNIDVDVDIPNLKIGVVSYEAVTITITGAYKNNVTGVHYAGYNSNNNHCSVTIPATTITGVSSTITSIVFAPPVTLTNSNGYGSIICAYSCNTTTSQGGCNTVDQVEAYMGNFFSLPANSLYAHRVQYGCWTGTQSVLAGGDCCASISGLTVTARPVDESCKDQCDGAVLAGAAGGNPPYNFTINSSSNLNNLCAGNYTLVGTDALLNTANQNVTVGSFGPAKPAGDSIQEFCGASTVKELTTTGSNIRWFENDTTSTELDSNLNLLDGRVYYASSTINGCESSERLKVSVVIYAGDLSVHMINKSLVANAQNVSYQWIDCSDNQPIIGANLKSFTPTVNGNYAVIITENACSDTSDCIRVEFVGISMNTLQKSLVIYPNPSKGHINIKYNADWKGGEVIVSSLNGQELFRKTLNNSAGTEQFQLNLAPGLYFIGVQKEKLSSGLFKLRIE